MTHPTPAEPDGQACGPGGFHMMKGLNATYAGSNWWLWDAQWSGLLGEDAEKCRVISVRLKRIQPEELWRRLREGTGRGANLKGAHLWGAHLEGANLKGANLWGANLEGANLGNTDRAYAEREGATMGEEK